MDVNEAIRTVLAVRSYTDTPVAAEVRDRILEAGRLTASAMNQQPWHFVVIEDRATLRKAGELMKTGPYVAGAAFAVVALVLKGNRIAVSDTSRAIQNMILAAWADGVASNWVGFGPLPAIEELVGAPEAYEALAVIPFGRPVAKIGRGRKKRKAFGEIASRERFGTPLG